MNSRTIILSVVLSVVLVVIFTFTAGLMTTEAKVVSDESSEAAKSEVQEPSGKPNKSYSAASYRSQFGGCFDVAIKDLATCREADQMPVQSYRSQFGECFDVSIKDLATCRDASLASVQVDRSPIDECFDESISELTSCRNASQALAP
jgi:hypothetical protein